MSMRQNIAIAAVAVALIGVMIVYSRRVRSGFVPIPMLTCDAPFTPEYAVDMTGRGAAGTAVWDIDEQPEGTIPRVDTFSAKRDRMRAKPGEYEDSLDPAIYGADRMERPFDPYCDAAPAPCTVKTPQVCTGAPSSVIGARKAWVIVPPTGAPYPPAYPQMCKGTKDGLLPKKKAAVRKGITDNWCAMRPWDCQGPGHDGAWGVSGFCGTSLMARATGRPGAAQDPTAPPCARRITDVDSDLPTEELPHGSLCESFVAEPSLLTSGPAVLKVGLGSTRQDPRYEPGRQTRLTGGGGAGPAPGTYAGGDSLGALTSSLMIPAAAWDAAYVAGLSTSGPDDSIGRKPIAFARLKTLSH